MPGHDELPPQGRSRHHAGKEFLSRPASGNHMVQFYEEVAFLSEPVAHFLGAGLAAGEPLVVIATAPHWQSFAQRLAAKGVDVQAACRTGQLTLLDAEETLSRLMVEGMPDARLFQETVGGVLQKSYAAGNGASVRAYGEMVDLLCREGNPLAAIRLEALWNDVAQRIPMSLLCAYDMSHFRQEAHAQAFHDVCGAHSHAIPTEAYSQLEDPEARLREVSRLQRHARALEEEIERRKQVEEALRNALMIRDDFLCVAGHELKTPLTALRLQLQSFQARLGDGEAEHLRERLGKVSRHTERLATLVETLLDVSRLSTGRLELQKETCDLSRLVRETVERASEAGSRAECPLTVLAEEPVAGRWDPLRLEQVVTNLLTNALKYGGGRPIEVRVQGAEQRARLLVRDHGIGIPLEHQARIFNRFERAAPSMNFGGLGLGLWITRQIVEAHGGTIHVESAPGQGATFVVEVPYHWEENAA